MNILDSLTKRINNCRDEVDKHNRKNLLLLSEGALLLSCVIMCMSLVLPYYRWLLLPHGLLFIYTIFLFFIARYCQKIQFKHIRALQYLLLAPLLLGGVLVSTVLDPSRPGVTVLIFICILPLFIIDNPWRLTGYQLVFAALFVGVAYYTKPPEIFWADMFYLPVYLAYIIGANIYVLLDKVEGVENYLLVCQVAEKDVLTELLNRKSGEARLKELLQRNVPGAFAIFDIDDFKFFNDRYGHPLGDAVLQEVSKAMYEVFRSTDVLWRLGGDEFAVYAVNMSDPAVCQQKFITLMQRLAHITVPNFPTLHVKISVGCTICTMGTKDFEQLYKISDAALYESKNNGKGKLVLKTA